MKDFSSLRPSQYGTCYITVLFWRGFVSEKNREQPHSADYFNEVRDFWWNLDFLQLMGQRWQVQDINTVLDVGCGHGHWGQVLSQILPEHSTVIGLDQESEWVEEAEQRAQRLGLAQRFRYEQGCAESIPFPDSHFDFVTCQTALIHLAEPITALREMVRVLKPGGLLAVAEPNNLSGLLMFDSLSVGESVDQICQTVEFHIICERGKMKLGQGNSSAGDLMPGYFTKLGLQDIQTYLSDKTSPLFPPYTSREQQASKQQHLDWTERGRWSRDVSLRYYLAGGGTEQAFESHWMQILHRNQLVKQMLLDEQFHGGGGATMYLVSGRKPN